MRTIKFRGLRTDGNGWVYGFYTKNNKSWIGSFAFDNYYHTEVLPESVGQFTGLTDKNGVEIYEGDWCRAEFRGVDGIKVIQGKIIQDEFMWCIDCEGCVGDEIFSINRPHGFETIGNIHQNKELL
jgi:uncharacterized phage protein (TIGR01671 family)